MSTSTEKICAFCGKPPFNDEEGNCIKMKTCSRCKKVYYHDVECQKKHWKVHKQSCAKTSSSSGQSRATKSSITSNSTKQKHRSIDTAHQLVTRRFKELRKQGVPIQEAMTRAREEYQPSEGDLDPASQGAFVIPFATFRNLGAGLDCTMCITIWSYWNEIANWYAGFY